jgi:N-acetyltransferase
MLTSAGAWVKPTTLECPGVVRTIRLVPLETRHAADLFAAADRELFRHSMQGPSEWSVRGFELELARVNSLPGVVAFAIVLAGVAGKDGLAIGRTTYMDIRPDHRGLEIGRTWIGRAYHGTRVNPEAKYLMLRHAFESLSPPAIRVQLTTNAENLHSQAAIAKLGAAREGVLRSARILSPGLQRSEPAIRDWVYFSILQEEWPRVKVGLESRIGRME